MPPDLSYISPHIECNCDHPRCGNRLYIEHDAVDGDPYIMAVRGDGTETFIGLTTETLAALRYALDIIEQRMNTHRDEDDAADQPPDPDDRYTPYGPFYVDDHPESFDAEGNRIDQEIDP